MIENSDFAIVILAAGSSKRMGKPKQMLEIHGTTLLQHSVNTAVASGIPNIVVVLGANAEEHKASLFNRPITLLENAQWERGMGSSLKVGVKKAIELFKDVQALIVMVCDQPLISSVHIGNLIKAFQAHEPLAIASGYNDSYGVPAVFDRSVFSLLIKIDDHSGARAILEKLKDDLVLVPFFGGEIDLDTPEEYQRFINGEFP